jgi:vancomycin permeability regulator SanA
MRPFASIYSTVGRPLALFLGLFTLLNIVGSWWSPGFDANGWWIDVGFLPYKIGHGILVYSALALVVVGVHCPRSWLVRLWVKTAVAALTLVTLANTAMFYWLWWRGRFVPGVKVPLSLILMVVLAFIAGTAWKPEPIARWSGRIVYGVTFLAALAAFPIAQMYFFGQTDYERDADAIVVFGAKANADGTPSQALYDRTHTGVLLFKKYKEPMLVFSGGPGTGAMSEPQVMRKVAMEEGVPAGVIILDEKGLNTDATVDHTVALFKSSKAPRIRTVLAVSHDYHLPRVKLTYERALAGTGITVYTVPAKESWPLTAKPYFMAREVAAFWVYYLRPLTGG